LQHFSGASEVTAAAAFFNAAAVLHGLQDCLRAMFCDGVTALLIVVIYAIEFKRMPETLQLHGYALSFSEDGK
jgi:hypothetical protein